MSGPVESGNAENEFGWWSSWTSALELADGINCYLSKDFQEAAFNRAVLIRPLKGVDPIVSDVFERFREFGSSPAFFIPEGPAYQPAADAVSRSGLEQIDRFLVMLSQSKVPHEARGIGVREVARDESEVWAKTYLHAFYGDLTLLDSVVKCFTSSFDNRANRLLLAEMVGEPVGTMATHHGGGLVGVYCLGTVPGARKMGAASALLGAAHDQAGRAGTRVILQTFESEGTEGFYTKQGFARAFAQRVFARA